MTEADGDVTDDLPEKPMAIEAGDVVVDAPSIGSRQVRLALAFLVCHRRQAVPRTQLADVVWPESLPPSWEGALRGVVSKVRAALAAAGLSSPEVLTSAFGCYQLEAGGDELVAIAQAHARDSHLVDLTAEVVLALAASPVAACDPSTK